MLNFADTARWFRSQLEPHRDPARAAHEKGYMKSELEFLGVAVPVSRSVVKAFVRLHKDLTREELWGVFDVLWSPGVWELRTLAITLLESYPSLIEPADLPRLKALTIESQGWAFNDSIGCHILGQLVQRHPSLQKQMDAWAVDEDLWVRRVAIQSLLLPLSSGDLTPWPAFVRYSEPLLGAKDFWTRKVIGWVLREVSKKNPGSVFDYLDRNRECVSGLTLREGAKYLGPTDRSRLGLKT